MLSRCLIPTSFNCARLQFFRIIKWIAVNINDIQVFPQGCTVYVFCQWTLPLWLCAKSGKTHSQVDLVWHGVYLWGPVELGWGCLQGNLSSWAVNVMVSLSGCRLLDLFGWGSWMCQPTSAKRHFALGRTRKILPEPWKCYRLSIRESCRLKLHPPKWWASPACEIEPPAGQFLNGGLKTHTDTEQKHSNGLISGSNKGSQSSEPSSLIRAMLSLKLLGFFEIAGIPPPKKKERVEWCLNTYFLSFWNACLDYHSLHFQFWIFPLCPSPLHTRSVLSILFLEVIFAGTAWSHSHKF